MLERVKDVKTVVFDETDAFTKGEMMLTDVVAVGPTADNSGVVTAGDEALDEDAVFRYVVSAERNNEHPPTRTIVVGTADRGLSLVESDGSENAPGHGIHATIDRKPIFVGNRRPLSDADVGPAPAEDTSRNFEGEGRIVMLVVIDDDLVGVVADADEVRESAVEAAAALRDRGATAHIVIGDSERTARAVAEQVDIDPDNVSAGVLSEDRADVVESLQADDMRIMVIGDGVSDVLAPAAVCVDTAPGPGTDMAIEAANVMLIYGDPLGMVKAIHISAGTLARIRQNLFWVLGYNTAVIPPALFGLPQPVFATGVMVLSSVSVLTNSLLSRSYTPDHDCRFPNFLRR